VVLAFVGRGFGAGLHGAYRYAAAHFPAAYTRAQCGNFSRDFVANDLRQR